MDHLLFQLDSWLRPFGGRKTLYAILVVFVAIQVVRRLLARSPHAAYLSQRQCDCGWRGQVSKFKPVCPRCGNPVSG